MFKIIAIVLSTLLIATFQIEAASAGCGGGHHRAFNTYQSKKPAKVAYKPARSKKPQAVAVAKPKKAVEQATATATLNEKTANANSTEVSDDNVTVAAIENTCTKFIAETGTTVTLECAKQ